jgi:hypothetical protein
MALLNPFKKFAALRTTACGTFALLSRIRLSVSRLNVAADELILAMTVFSSRPAATIFMTESLVRTPGSELGRSAGAAGCALRGAAGCFLVAGRCANDVRGICSAINEVTISDEHLELHIRSSGPSGCKAPWAKEPVELYSFIRVPSRAQIIRPAVMWGIQRAVVVCDPAPLWHRPPGLVRAFSTASEHCVCAPRLQERVEQFNPPGAVSFLLHAIIGTGAETLSSPTESTGYGGQTKTAERSQSQNRTPRLLKGGGGEGRRNCPASAPVIP